MNRRKTTTYTYAGFNPPRPQIWKIDRGFDRGTEVGVDTKSRGG